MSQLSQLSQTTSLLTMKTVLPLQRHMSQTMSRRTMKTALVIPHKSARLRESGLLANVHQRSFAALRMTALDCHPERVSRSPEERRGRISRGLMRNHQKQRHPSSDICHKCPNCLKL